MSYLMPLPEEPLKPWGLYLRRGVVGGGVLAATLLGFIVAINYWRGHGVLFWAEVIEPLVHGVLGFGFLLGLGSVGVVLLALFGRSTRRPAVAVILGTLTFSATSIALARLPYRARLLRLERVAHDATPLVDAIHAFERAQGVPPSDLEALVPEFLDTLPSTGLGAFPEFSYEARTGESARTPAWELWIDVKPSLGCFDRFVYQPGRVTDSGELGARSVPVGDWAYTDGELLGYR